MWDGHFCPKGCYEEGCLKAVTTDAGIIMLDDEMNKFPIISVTSVLLIQKQKFMQKQILKEIKELKITLTKLIGTSELQPQEQFSVMHLIKQPNNFKS